MAFVLTVVEAAVGILRVYGENKRRLLFVLLLLLLVLLLPFEFTVWFACSLDEESVLTMCVLFEALLGDCFLGDDLLLFFSSFWEVVVIAVIKLLDKQEDAVDESEEREDDWLCFEVLEDTPEVLMVRVMLGWVLLLLLTDAAIDAFSYEK